MASAALQYDSPVADQSDLRWTPSVGPGGFGNKGVEAPAFSVLFLFERIFKPLSSLFSVAAVGMWATRLRCPSEAAYPQLPPVARAHSCRRATRSLVVGCSLI